METIFFDLNIVGSWVEIKLVVGDRGEFVVDDDSGRFRIGGDV